MLAEYTRLHVRGKRSITLLLSKQHELHGHANYPCPGPTGQHKVAQVDAFHTVGYSTAEETQF